MTDDARARRLLAAAEAGEGDDETADLRWALAALREFAPGKRGVCPQRDILMAYQTRELAEDQLGEVAAHVHTCPFCASDLADLQALQAPPLLAVTAALGRAGLRLLSHSFDRAAQPEPLAVRGSEVAPEIALSGAGEDLEIEVSLQTVSATAIDLRVELRRHGEPVQRARINLYRGDDLLESRLAPLGEVRLSELPPGEYLLTLSPPDSDETLQVAVRLQPAEQAEPA